MDEITACLDDRGHMLIICAADMRRYPLSKEVGNVRNDRPDLIVPREH